ncbi:MAG: hypothetical protein H0T62_06310 [Parachlamydiaceae bacterium]|nr:hypothetical protein [Parachlamydiaceae bacterium]
MHPLYAPPTLIHTRNELVEKIPEHSLTVEDRITRFALLVLLVVLIFPIFFGWPKVERLWLETYDGIDRTSYFTNEAFETALDPILDGDDMGPLCKCNYSAFKSLFQDESAELDKQMREECKSLTSDVKNLKNQMSRFDNFIKEHKELFEICLSYLQTFPEFISPSTEIPSTLNRDDPIDLRTMLLMEKNNLEHNIQERKNFFMRHQEVYAVFLKYIKEMPEEIEYL